MTTTLEPPKTTAKVSSQSDHELGSEFPYHNFELHMHGDGADTEIELDVFGPEHRRIGEIDITHLSDFDRAAVLEDFVGDEDLVSDGAAVLPSHLEHTLEDALRHNAEIHGSFGEAPGEVAEHYRDAYRGTTDEVRPVRMVVRESAEMKYYDIVGADERTYQEISKRLREGDKFSLELDEESSYPRVEEHGGKILLAIKLPEIREDGTITLEPFRFVLTPGELITLRAAGSSIPQQGTPRVELDTEDHDRVGASLKEVISQVESRYSEALSQIQERAAALKNSFEPRKNAEQILVHEFPKLDRELSQLKRQIARWHDVASEFCNEERKPSLASAARSWERISASMLSHAESLEHDLDGMINSCNSNLSNYSARLSNRIALLLGSAIPMSMLFDWLGNNVTHPAFEWMSNSPVGLAISVSTAAAATCWLIWKGRRDKIL